MRQHLRAAGEKAEPEAPPSMRAMAVVLESALARRDSTAEQRAARMDARLRTLERAVQLSAATVALANPVWRPVQR